ncbi:MAG TPA: KTSC domain-containing protein [Stellaceae bacterium]|nr:KTSC domain-containing protein [Stellaceae bacterium]
MRRKQVQSSAIRSVGYDARREIFEIEFTSGTHYQYDEFPQSLDEEFMRAHSKGQFFREYILEEFSFSRV